VNKKTSASIKTKLKKLARTKTKEIVAVASADSRSSILSALASRKSVGALLFCGHGTHRRTSSRRLCTQSPIPHAGIVATTTHKTLRGPARRPHGAVQAAATSTAIRCAMSTKKSAPRTLGGIWPMRSKSIDARIGAGQETRRSSWFVFGGDFSISS